MFIRFFSLVRFFLTIVYDTSLLHLESVFSGFLRDDVQIADFVREKMPEIVEESVFFPSFILSSIMAGATFHQKLKVTSNYFLIKDPNISASGNIWEILIDFDANFKRSGTRTRKCLHMLFRRVV